MTVGVSSSGANLQCLCWQGWRLDIPAAWNPVKVDGDYDQGSVLIADMEQAKLGLRWRKASGGEPAKWANRMLNSEVGKLAAEEAGDYTMPEYERWKVSRLYIEPKPPGRDVWGGWSDRTGRVMEVIHHAKTRDRVLQDQILASLFDSSQEQAQAWSIFDISCRTPAGWTLQWYRLNAGDLSLSFRKGRTSVTIRQIAPATLALARQSMDGWLGQQEKAARKLYRDMGDLADANLTLGGRSREVRRGAFVRKRRLFWAFMVPRRVVAIGFHDTSRNRLILGQGDDESALTEIMGSVGWAKAPSKAA